MCAAADTAPRVLFITLSNIGDLVLSTPALRALHAAYPDHRVDIVADARSSALLRACPFLGDLCHRDKRAGWRGTWALVRALRGRRYAAIVDLRTGFAPWLLRGARRTAGWRRGVHGPHAVEQHFAVVARVLPAPVTAAGIPSTQVWITDADTREAAALLAPLPRGRWLALAPGANWPGKVWPRAHYAALVARLTDAFSGVVLLGGGADRAITEHLAAHSPLPCVDLAGRTSLTVAAAVCDRVAGFVGNDSGLGHLAAARGIPTLTLFGPGRPERYRPWGPRARVLIAPRRDLTTLTAQDAEAAVRALLSNVNEAG